MAANALLMDPTAPKVIAAIIMFFLPNLSIKPAKREPLINPLM